MQANIRIFLKTGAQLVASEDATETPHCVLQFSVRWIKPLVFVVI